MSILQRIELYSSSKERVFQNFQLYRAHRVFGLRMSHERPKVFGVLRRTSSGVVENLRMYRSTCLLEVDSLVGVPEGLLEHKIQHAWRL